MGSHLGQLPAHYGRHPGHVRHCAVSLQIPHICEYIPHWLLLTFTLIKPESVHAETDLCLCLAVCSMAGPLGGLELIHYLLLSGGWKPVTGNVCVFRLVVVCDAINKFDICSN